MSPSQADVADDAAAASSETSSAVADADAHQSLIPHVVAGIAGRCAAETFKSPFDLLKVRRQYNLALQERPLPLALAEVMRTEGFNAWRGLPPRLIWSAPLAGATFTYYQVLKSETGGEKKEEGDASKSRLSMKTILGGPAVLGLSVALRTPFDIVEQQLQLANAPQAAKATETASAAAAPKVAASSAAVSAGLAEAGTPSTKLTPTPRAIARAIHATWVAEGVRGVWRGYPAAFLGITTYVAGYFVIYEGARRAIEQRGLLDAGGPACTLVAGGLGGGLTAVLATPFDTIKVRMQTKVYASAAQPYPSLYTVTAATLREGGQAGLWRGATYRFASNAPSGAIMFAVYEGGYRWIERRFFGVNAFRA